MCKFIKIDENALNYEKMVLLECAVDSERNDVNNYVVSCSVAELFIH